MTLRDMEKDAVALGRRWLHDLLFADWGLKLLAFAVTFGLWLAVTGQRVPATARLRHVQLHFVVPNELEIANEPREEIDITVRGSKRVLNTLRAADVVATFDASGYQPGERVVPLSHTTLSLDLPEGVSHEGLTIERVEPPSIPLRLERSVEREFEVAPRIEGRPAAGYELLGVESRPPRVRVRGPESHVNALEKVLTETVLIEGKTESFVVPQVAVDIPDRKLVPLTPIVDVLVRVGEERTTRRIPNISVRPSDGEQGTLSPARATVELRGPRSLVESLRPEEIALVIEPVPGGGTRVRLVLPPGQEESIELLSTQPSEFKLVK